MLYDYSMLFNSRMGPGLIGQIFLRNTPEVNVKCVVQKVIFTWWEDMVMIEE